MSQTSEESNHRYDCPCSRLWYIPKIAEVVSKSHSNDQWMWDVVSVGYKIDPKKTPYVIFAKATVGVSYVVRIRVSKEYYNECEQGSIIQL